MTLRVATLAALGAHVLLGTVSTGLFLLAYQLRADWFAEPGLVVAGGVASAELFKWAAITDLFSYYLPQAVVAIALWVALRRPGSVLAEISTVAALGYVLAGGAGAAVLAMEGSALIVAHAEPGADQDAIAMTFGVLAGVVFRGIWQLLDGILLAVWFGGVGILVRDAQPELGRLAIAIAGLAAIGTVLNVVGLGLLRDLTLGVIFVLWAAWSIWLAMLVWRRRPPFDGLEGRRNDPRTVGREHGGTAARRPVR